MDMSGLVDKYFDQIEIENIDYVPVDDAVSDAAYLLLNIPIAMLKEYSRLNCQNEDLPDGTHFWNETGLKSILLNSDKYHGQGHLPHLSDVLDYLGENVESEYQRVNNSEKIRLIITEMHHPIKN